MEAPDVTVVIPTRDRRESLLAALAGARRQEEVLLELLVIDDGGTVGVAELVHALDDPRLRVLRLDSPRGPATARNVGIAEARGRWIGFLDDDDLWAPSKLRRQLDAAAAAGARWAWCGACHIELGGEVFWVDPAPDPNVLPNTLPSGSVIPAGASNVLVETELVREAGGFDEEIYHLPDWDLWIRLAAADRGAAVDEPLVAYVQHAGMLSRRRSEMLSADFARVERKLNALGLQATDRKVGRGLFEWIAEGQLMDGRRASAAGTFARSALRHVSATDALQAVGSLGGGRGLALARRVASRFTPNRPAPRLEVPDWLRAYPEFPWGET